MTIVQITRGLIALSAVLAIVFMYGCELMVGGWILQGAPGVLTEGAKIDPSQRITDSQVVRVEGVGWTKALHIHEVYYRDLGRVVTLVIFVRNGGSGLSKPGALLVDFQLSNYEARAKEQFAFAPGDVQLILSSQTVRPTASMSCHLMHRKDHEEYFSQVPGWNELPPGGTACLTLKFPVDPPSGNESFQIKVPRIDLGAQILRDVVVTFGKIYG